jgi:hypothetical protein
MTIHDSGLFSVRSTRLRSPGCLSICLSMHDSCTSHSSAVFSDIYSEISKAITMVSGFAQIPNSVLVESTFPFFFPTEDGVEQ